MNNNINSIIFSMIALLIAQSANSMTIYNYNQYTVDIEIMDCPSSKAFGFPSSWRAIEQLPRPVVDQNIDPDLNIKNLKKYSESLENNMEQLSKRLSNIHRVEFMYNNSIPANHMLIIDKYFNQDRPANLCYRIHGWTGTDTGKVKSSCEMTIYDNGFLQGIRAEHQKGC